MSIVLAPGQRRLLHELFRRDTLDMDEREVRDYLDRILPLWPAMDAQARATLQARVQAIV